MSEDMLSVEEARARILAAARPLAETESVAAGAALGRVLAAPLVSPLDVPPLDNAAMDGYALRQADHAEGRWLPVGQRIPAGTLGALLPPGQAARIFTGAPLPAGADCVAMQEDCETRPDHSGGTLVRIGRAPRPGDHVRRAGEDIRTGQAVLAGGDRLDAARLGVAASVGATHLDVFRRLRVAVFFTGDELAQPGQPLAPGQIYNSNRATLCALLDGLGCEIVDLGQVADNLAATEAALAEAASLADVVITSGGVSVGEEDHVKAAVTRLGRIDMWKVAMKPGKPLVYGRVGEADFLGLPGNPVSAFVVFCLFARPFLLARMGTTPVLPTGYPVPAGFERSKPGSRREFLRARLREGAASLHPNQSSAVLTSLAWADGLVDIEAGRTVGAGDAVRYLPLAELLA
jgi:molybdopterin molybdotransferase